jgi:hypothetical protein
MRAMPCIEVPRAASQAMACEYGAVPYKLDNWRSGLQGRVDAFDLSRPNTESRNSAYTLRSPTRKIDDAGIKIG